VEGFQIAAHLGQAAYRLDDTVYLVRRDFMHFDSEFQSMRLTKHTIDEYRGLLLVSAIGPSVRIRWFLACRLASCPSRLMALEVGEGAAAVRTGVKHAPLRIAPAAAPFAPACPR
jgi:hypothetical protein